MNGVIDPAPSKRAAAIAVKTASVLTAAQLLQAMSGNVDFMQSQCKVLGNPTTRIINMAGKVQDPRATQLRGEKRKHNNRLADTTTNDENNYDNSNPPAKPTNPRHTAVTPTKDIVSMGEENPVPAAGFVSRHKVPDTVDMTWRNSEMNDDDDEDVIDFTQILSPKPTPKKATPSGRVDHPVSFVPSEDEIAAVKQDMVVHLINNLERMVNIYAIDNDNNDDNNEAVTGTRVPADPNGTKRFNRLVGETKEPFQLVVNAFIGGRIANCHKQGCLIDAAKFCIAFDKWFFAEGGQNSK